MPSVAAAFLTTDTAGPTTVHTVAEAMVTSVKLSAAGATVADLRRLFADDHVHCAVIVGGGRLLAVVDRGDLVGAADDAPGVDLGTLAFRTTTVDTPLERAWELLLASGRRRLAVVDRAGHLCGLLCVKRTRRGFCSDRDVAARTGEAAARATDRSCTPDRSGATSVERFLR